jgi:hypothetical protein
MVTVDVTGVMGCFSILFSLRLRASKSTPMSANGLVLAAYDKKKKVKTKCTNKLRFHNQKTI